MLMLSGNASKQSAQLCYCKSWRIHSQKEACPAMHKHQAEPTQHPAIWFDPSECTMTASLTAFVAACSAAWLLLY
jgi:hypothetical protein